MKIKAPAKLNLSLEIIGKRRDGFHDISSIIQTISLFDNLQIDIDDHLTLESPGFDLDPNENIVYITAKNMREQYSVSIGARMILQKQIPVSAGLGGGSSDAAATIKILNKIWGLNLPFPELIAFASTVGSDVPFFLEGGTSFVHGRGELIRGLPDCEVGWIVIIVPELKMKEKTKSMYSYLGEDSYTTGGLSRKLEARIRNGGDCPPQLMFNGFLGVAKKTIPSIQEALSVFNKVGVQEIHLTGSGPSLFTIVKRKEIASALSLLITHKHQLESYVVDNVSRNKFQF
ncbi:MAG: 4-diphosphocytidyl-2-C-methyl-D-erythritol kinase [Chloroflexi bacterium]|jgi:4-diphosphocytidyl-2-C-methyl-D-erythritol kinase|nr:MAG: 4-diphosphocytidyl-2-C-methyl-D-erythritol kinase [Chloroflexota bacterium]